MSPVAALFASADDWPPLPEPVQLPAAAGLPGGRTLTAGGLDAADASVSTITAVRGRRAQVVGNLPRPVHDAGGVALGHRAYVFGGGTGESGSDEIVAVD